MANTLNQLEEDDRLKEPVIRFPAIDRGLEGWYDMKRRLNEQSGIQFGFDYNSLSQNANRALTDDDKAWSGLFRILASWELSDPGQADALTLVFGFENRHAIGGRIPPSALAGQLGYIGITGTLFNDAGTILGNLYLRKLFPNGKGGWKKTPLLPAIQRKWPKRGAIYAGTMTFDRDGRLYAAVTTIIGGEGEAWGHPSKKVALLVSKDGGRTFEVFEIGPPDPATPNWFPSLERPTGAAPIGAPSLTYQHGHAGKGCNDIMSNAVLFCDVPTLLARGR